jgi:hypothetical protein
MAAYLALEVDFHSDLPDNHDLLREKVKELIEKSFPDMQEINVEIIEHAGGECVHCRNLDLKDVECSSRGI